MTREKAIDFNKNLRMYMRLADKNQPCKFLEENYIALDMAIKALEQQPCGDAISRQAVIDAIYARYIGGKEAVDKAPANDHYAEGIDEAVCAVEDLPLVTPQQNRWIPVSERLPEKDGCYLVTTTGTNNDIIDIAFYTDDIWHKASKVKAWMPLPEPYKAESEEEA